jgi:hypothetical protein
VQAVDAAVTKVLAPFLSFWASRELDPAALEALLTGRLTTVALPLINLIRETVRSPELEAELQPVRSNTSLQRLSYLQRHCVGHSRVVPPSHVPAQMCVSYRVACCLSLALGLSSATRPAQRTMRNVQLSCS